MMSTVLDYLFILSINMAIGSYIPQWCIISNLGNLISSHPELWLRCSFRSTVGVYPMRNVSIKVVYAWQCSFKKMYILYTNIYVVCGASKYTLASKAKDIYYNICMQIRIKNNCIDDDVVYHLDSIIKVISQTY